MILTLYYIISILILVASFFILRKLHYLRCHLIEIILGSLILGPAQLILFAEGEIPFWKQSYEIFGDDFTLRYSALGFSFIQLFVNTRIFSLPPRPDEKNPIRDFKKPKKNRFK